MAGFLDKGKWSHARSARLAEHERLERLATIRWCAFKSALFSVMLAAITLFLFLGHIQSGLKISFLLSVVAIVIMVYYLILARRLDSGENSTMDNEKVIDIIWICVFIAFLAAVLLIFYYVP